MAGSDRKPFLDRPAARFIALIVLLLCAASLVYLHRDDLFPKAVQATAAGDNDPAAACIAERFTDIEKMVTEGTIESAQAKLFRQRAEAMCRDMADGGKSSAPSLPGLPKE